MSNKQDLSIRALSLGMRSELETIKEYNSHEYIPNRGLSTIGAYLRKNGNDAKSLNAKIIKLQGCKLENDSGPKVVFNDKTRIISVLFDKSKIRPISDNGYIIIEVSGNYGFKELLKFPWYIKKILLEPKNDWITIEKEDEPITWITGYVTIAKISFHIPDEIKNNEIWYQINNPSIEFVGKGANLYSVQATSELSFNEQYYIQYNCRETLNVPIERKIDIKLEGTKREDSPQNICIKFTPAIRQITAHLENSTELYTLGSTETTLAQLSLVNKCEDINAIGCVKIDIESYIGPKKEDGLIICDELTVEVKANQLKTVMININPKKLKQLPKNDVDVTITVEGKDVYTDVNFSKTEKTHSEHFKLTI